jgi:hypothetical protein
VPQQLQPLDQLTTPLATPTDITSTSTHRPLTPLDRTWPKVQTWPITSTISCVVAFLRQGRFSAAAIRLLLLSTVLLLLLLAVQL